MAAQQLQLIRPRPIETSTGPKTARQSDGLLLWASGAEDGATGRPPELPGRNDEIYAQPENESGQPKKRRRNKTKNKKKPPPQREELEGNNRGLFMRLFGLGYLGGILGVIGLTDQQERPMSALRSRIIGFCVAALLMGAATTYFAAKNFSWDIPGEVIAYICAMIVVVALVFAITPCIELVKKLKELFQHLGDLIMENRLSIWLRNAWFVCLGCFGLLAVTFFLSGFNLPMLKFPCFRLGAVATCD